MVTIAYLASCFSEGINCGAADKRDKLSSLEPRDSHVKSSESIISDRENESAAADNIFVTPPTLIRFSGAAAYNIEAIRIYAYLRGLDLRESLDTH